MTTDATPSPSKRRRRAARVALVAGTIVAIGGGSIAVFGGAGNAPGASRGQPASAKGKATGLDVFTVQKADFDVTTTATGELRARKQIEVRNQLESQATVVEIVPEGTFVRKGELLLKLNSEEIVNQIEQQSLELERAKADAVEAVEGYEIQVSENESALRAAQLKLDLAELDLRQWQDGEFENKRQELSHQLERTEKDELRLREKLEKSRQLLEKKFYSLDQFKQDELSWEQAEAALEKARLDNDVYYQYQYPKDLRQKESTVEEARAELERTKRQSASKLASKEAARNNARQSLALREQKFAKLQEQLRNATIMAPSDGLVVYATSLENARWGGEEGPLQVGSKVWPNQNVIVLPDTSEMIAQVKVHESLAGRLRPGQPASVKVDAAGGRKFVGRVESIGILAEQTSRWMDPNLREYTVKIALEIPKDPPTEADPGMSEGVPGGDAAGGGAGRGGPSGGHGLKPSMRCEADVTLGRVNGAVTVPIQAVHNEGMLRFVHIADGSGRFARRPVMLGQRSDRFAEIRAGVEPGERVLLRKPDAGEVLNEPWDAKQLAAVGLQTNERGEVVPTGRPGGGGPGGPAMAGGRSPGRGAPKPGGEAAPAEAALAVKAEGAPPEKSGAAENEGAEKKETPAAEPAPVAPAAASATG